MNLKQIIAAVFATAAISGGGTYAVFGGETMDEAKKAILKENIHLAVRLNEIPEWNISLVSAEEMSDAYIEKAKELGEITEANLWEDIRKKVEKRGEVCKII